MEAGFWLISLALLGTVLLIFYTVRASLNIFGFFRTYILTRLRNADIDFKQFGSWAVVTGSSDGIGKAYAQELARRGLNVILISRSYDRVRRVAREIEAVYHVKTKCIAVDFTVGSEVFRMLGNDLHDIHDIAVLVNNVGTTRQAPMKFIEHPDDVNACRDIINVNCNAVTFLTKLVLPKMVERKCGVIINISSVFGYFPTPYSNVYSATKAFIDFLSRSVHAEYSADGIIVQSVLPGPVATAMTGIKEASWLVPDASTYVKSALKTVGLQTRTFGYWPHAVLAYGYSWMPEWVYNRHVTRLLLNSTKRKNWERSRDKKSN